MSLPQWISLSNKTQLTYRQGCVVLLALQDAITTYHLRKDYQAREICKSLRETITKIEAALEKAGGYGPEGRDPLLDPFEDEIKKKAI